MTGIVCTRCGKPYPIRGAPFFCECGGIFDFADFPLFDSHKIDSKQPGLWKYRSLLGLDAEVEPVTLGEGNTPLAALDFRSEVVYLKLEYQNPTASYKDRGTAVLISFLQSRGVSYAIEDSSGNAGASFAAYAARAGMKARVYVPNSASGPKRAQIEAYGAELVQVPGARANAAAAVLNEARAGAAYASHAFMPFGLTGIATIAYEIAEQLNEAPGTIIAPVGHGGLMYGVMKGFEAQVAGHRLEQEPYYLGVQSAACAPVTRGYQQGLLTAEKIIPGETLAEGVKVSDPARGDAILSHISKTRGKMIEINEEQLLQAYNDLARLGFFVEPTSALVYAALQHESRNLPRPVVMILTGAGTKTKSI